jgi:GR25 family glycosyltransferase involved in LPS biosynthesis
MINKLFDKTYLINLDRRTDRLIEVNKLTEKFDFEFTRVSAVDGESLVEGENGVPVFTEDQLTYLRFNKSSYALNLTMISILKEAVKKKYKNILICEDDLRFKDNYFEVFSTLKTDMPFDYDLFYFGCTHLVPFKYYNYNVGIVREVNACHCFGINSSIFQKLLAELEKNEKPLDMILRETIQRRGNSFCLVPNLAYQESGISDIGGGVFYDTSFTR